MAGQQLNQSGCIFVTACASALCSASSWGTNRHVGSGQAYTTVQAAVNAAANGDVILVHPGTYMVLGGASRGATGRTSEAKSATARR
ncbi:MAG: hypothetical protein O2800_04750 [Planctomycetota bacterium]|nr:hypothetical protein [Planctomycetota bacterium]